MKGLILSYLITAIGSIAALRYPLIGLCVYVGYAILRPEFIWGYAGDLTGLSLVLGVALLVGWAAKSLGSWHFGRGWAVVAMLLTFVAWFTLSGIFALDPSSALPTLIELSKTVLPFLVGVTMMTEEKHWRPVLWTIVLAQGYVGLEMNQNYLFKGFNTAADGFGGMDNNCFGVSLVTVIGPAIALAVSSKTWKTRALATAALLLILHTTLLTFSRGAMVGLVAVAVTAFVLMPKRPKFLAAVAGAIILAIWLTGPELAARYGTIFAPATDRDASAESRVDLWRDCIKVIEQYPIFGVGPANWRIVAANYGWSEGKSAHSVWMETAAENGIPGALALFAFFGIAAIRVWPIARARLTDANRWEVAAATGVVLSIAGFVVAGQFVSVPGLEVPYYVTMVGVAMLRSRKAAVAVEVVNRPAPVPMRVGRAPFSTVPPPRRIGPQPFTPTNR